MKADLEALSLTSCSPPPRPDRLPAGRLLLRVTCGPDFGRQLPLRPGTFLVGRDPDCDLTLQDPEVAGVHLGIVVAAEQIRIRDLDSSGGSFCNGVRFFEIAPGLGAIVSLGGTELQLVRPEPAAQPLSRHDHFGALWGRSAPMRQLFAALERVSATDAAVLVEGETGTGKDLCARAIHERSRRARGPFVVLDLAGMQPNLIESELFGHVRGAFTGAISDRPGAFERASGGTLFLDELGELSPELQPRLLRALENRQTKRVGANDYVDFDARLIAATNRNLEQEVRGGRFRADLFHRLAVVRLELPPLRERREDIAFLAAKIVDSLGGGLELTPEMRSTLIGYDWPGNVRELRNVVERTMALGGSQLSLPSFGGLAVESVGRGLMELAGFMTLPFKEAKERVVEIFERDYVAELVGRSRRNVSRAAREAGIDRGYLHRLLRKHGVGM